MSDARLRCAFLVMDDESAFVTDYRPGIPPLEARGWRVDRVPWRRPDVDWAAWHAVYIGAPWDYPEDPARFLAVLGAIDAAGAVLVNPLELVHWNLDKRYLFELEAGGAAIVPTTGYARFADADPAQWFGEHATDRIVIKPRVGANAADTFVLERPPAAPVLQQLAGLFAERPFLIQPFLASIRDPGEYSLFYLGGALSHAIRKVPKPGDFRVQEEHGAEILAAAPDAALRSAGERVMALVAPAPAYARADFVLGADGRWLLMELELVEPSLYLRMDRDAPARFARAIDEYARSRLGRAADRR